MRVHYSSKCYYFVWVRSAEVSCERTGASALGYEEQTSVLSIENNPFLLTAERGSAGRSDRKSPGRFIAPV